MGRIDVTGAVNDAASQPLPAGSGPVIALLGAESTGKTALAVSVAEGLVRDAAARGRRIVVVTEYLREFCDARGRTPRPEEQALIAAEQWRRITAAAADGSIVLADTTPLMTAVYSEQVFGDRSLYPLALDHQRRCALTLLTGLDLPWQPDGLQRDSPGVRAPVDALIRRALAGAGLSFPVVYGAGAARASAALVAVRAMLPAVLGLGPDADKGNASHNAAGEAATEGSRPRLRCRDCLQPDCEHRLFAGLSDAANPARVPSSSTALSAPRAAPPLSLIRP
jgi:nicotinamide riboside kinase